MTIILNFKSKKVLFLWLTRSVKRKMEKLLLVFELAPLSAPATRRARDGTLCPGESFSSGSTILNCSMSSLLGSAITGYETLYPGCMHKLCIKLVITQES